MRLIHKFPAVVGTTAQIKVTRDAKIVHFAAQGQELCIWVEFDPSREEEFLNYRIFATGEPIQPPVELEVGHRASCLMMDGTYVWHLYEVMPR